MDILEQDAVYPDLLCTQGDHLQLENRPEEALPLYRQALNLQPGLPRAMVNMGVALLELNRIHEAEMSFRRAASADPFFPEAFYNLGKALTLQKKYQEAIGYYLRAVELKPEMAEAHNNLGRLLRLHGFVADANICYRNAVFLRQNDPEMHTNLAFTHFLQGDYDLAWEEFEWRLLRSDYRGRGRFAPVWKGEPLNGRTLLVRYEGGYGDTLQFLRYLKYLHVPGNRIALECQPSLIPLLCTHPNVDIILQSRRPDPPQCKFDLEIDLMSLPLYLWKEAGWGTNTVPYLFAPLDRISDWKKRLSEFTQKFRVGFVWAGNPLFPNDASRSCPLAEFGPLFTQNNIQFFSLQKHESEKAESGLSADTRFVDLGPFLKDYADTAAVIQLMDLIITVDTSTAHLAGAMGKPVWTLLPFAPDWRWLLSRQDTPWYPTMRLYRQPAPEDWQGLFAQVLESLKEEGLVTRTVER